MNRQLLTEWNGVSTDSARQNLMLPGERRTMGRRRSSITAIPDGWSATPTELDMLWDRSVA